MGSISYETYLRGSSDGEDAILDRVSGFIATQSSSSFSGFWMMVAQWDRVHPFPHGYNAAGLSQDYTEFLQSVRMCIVLCVWENRCELKDQKGRFYKNIIMHVIFFTGEHLSNDHHYKRSDELCSLYLQVRSDGLVRIQHLCHYWLQPEWRLQEPFSLWAIICKGHCLFVISHIKLVQYSVCC